jgi:hypothetical protein
VGTPFALESCAKWFAVIVMGVLSLWLATGRTWSLNFFLEGQEFNASFFNAQSVSLLDGRLDVPSSNFAWTECFIVDGRCFGYFGVTPSLLRIPLVALGGSSAPYFIPVSIALAVTLTTWAILDLFQRLVHHLIPDSSARDLPMMAGTISLFVLLGPGSILTYLSKPRVYHEASLWMIAFLLVSMNLVYRWLFDRRIGLLLIAGIAAVLSTNARPSGAMPALILGLGVVIVLVADRRARKPSRSELALASGLAILPALTSMGVLWLKFGTASLPWEKYNLYESEGYRRLSDLNGGQLQGIRFIPTNLINYLRPDSLRFSTSAPFVIEQVPSTIPAITLWPIDRNGMFVEGFVSLTNAMPLSLLLSVGIVVAVLMGRVKMSRIERQSFGILFLASAAGTVVVLTSVALTTRYLGDFFPLMAIGSIYAIAHLLTWLRGRPRAVLVVTALLLVVSLGNLFVQLQLTTS